MQARHLHSSAEQNSLGNSNESGQNLVNQVKRKYSPVHCAINCVTEKESTNLNQLQFDLFLSSDINDKCNVFIQHTQLRTALNYCTESLEPGIPVDVI